MPYSDCCGAFSYRAPEYDICPECKEHADWIYDDDIENEHIDEKKFPVREQE
jgi:hypothetical protein